MRLRLLQLKNWRKRQRIKHHPAVYLQHHFVILMCLIFIFLQTTEQKAPHIGLGCSLHKQWGRVSGTPNVYLTWDGARGYEAQVNTNLPIQFKNSALFAVANILTDAGDVVDEKAECCNLRQGTLTLKIASSRQGQSLTACYFIIGY